MKQKKGVSELVVTVSLILVAIVAVSIIAAFVVPMVKKQLQKAGACVELRNHFSVNIASLATCYTGEKINLSIQRGWENGDVKGFAITIYGEAGKAVSKKETDLTGFDVGEANLYSYSITGLGNIEKVSIAAILPNDEVCDPVDYAGISKC